MDDSRKTGMIIDAFFEQYNVKWNLDEKKWGKWGYFTRKQY